MDATQSYDNQVLLDGLRPGDIIESDGATFRVGWSSYGGETEWSPGWSRDPLKPWITRGPDSKFAVSVTEVGSDDPNELNPEQIEKWWNLQSLAEVHVRLPESLARYFQRYHSSLRYIMSQGKPPFGPSPGAYCRCVAEQLVFLSEVAHAFHNLAEPFGAECFFDHAKRINAAWEPHQAALADNRFGGAYLFDGLYPLPERP
jgi:hypothetical protein